MLWYFSVAVVEVARSKYTQLEYENTLTQEHFLVSFFQKILQNDRSADRIDQVLVSALLFLEAGIDHGLEGLFGGEAFVAVVQGFVGESSGDPFAKFPNCLGRMRIAAVHARRKTQYDLGYVFTFAELPHFVFEFVGIKAAYTRCNDLQGIGPGQACTLCSVIYG